MSYRKFQGTAIFDGERMLAKDQVLICDEQGTIQAILPEAEAGEDIEKLDGVITPGFINCHCHLELSHMKGLIPEKTGLIDFVFAVVTQRHFADEEILQAVAEAEADMLRNGIVAVGDICNNTLTLAQKEKKNLNYYNFIEASGWLPAAAETRFERSKGAFDLFSKNLVASIVPHAPYSVSEDLWKLINPFYKNRVVSIHNQETVFEDELFLQNTGDFVRMYEMMKLDTSFFKPSGKSSLQTYFLQLQEADHVLLVHNTFTRENDLQYLVNTRNLKKTFFCLCVNANQYIEQAFPPIDLLKAYNCNIVIGTDSLASNWSLHILDELKTIHKRLPQLSASESLGWATLNGAKALQMDKTLGSFEKGKLPGVVLIEGFDREHIETLQSSKAVRLL